jgi:hypothetical protein
LEISAVEMHEDARCSTTGNVVEPDHRGRVLVTRVKRSWSGGTEVDTRSAQRDFIELAR